MGKGNRMRRDDEFDELISQVADDPEFSRLGAGRAGAVGAPAAGPRDYVLADPADDFMPTAPPISSGARSRVVAGWLLLGGGLILAVLASVFLTGLARSLVGLPGLAGLAVGFVLLLTSMRRGSAADADDGAVV
ncbi:hypothetical protein EII12_00965 [Buchananella hordeovulneris]|uniref:hypothetical protein n=1 Tax=Buchananella hordeovulneris TaxID=52770 RepID=UPI000F5DF8C6|nr:hypothetical protein [Buchananella hordeovulneris]RRD53937.1 hypothetical protein EII12_00965 [Buchananella hordeovulneris]